MKKLVSILHTHITRENAKWYEPWREEISKYLAKLYMYLST